MEHADRAERYARNVVSGKIDACKWIKLQCKRHLDDLKASRLPFDFDPSPANRVCRFIEQLPHIKGRWETANIKLEDWQCFSLAVPFGWKRKDGTRRYRTVYIEVPRKNAKSTLTAGVGLYMLGPDGEPGAECYSAATTRDQAAIVWGVAREMVKKSPELQRAGYQAHAHSITFQDSFFKALSADAHSLEGLNIHFGGIDELHAHKTRHVHDVIVEATGSRRQPLVWKITTAGSDRAGVCYEQRNYCLKVLEGVAEDDTTFSLVYTLDEDDLEQWDTPRAAKKANPNYGASIFADQLAERANQARQNPSEVANYKTKRLNVWVSADNPLFDVLSWDKCADPTLNIDDWLGSDCYFALDLATKTDLAAMCAVFRRDDQYAVFPWSWLPEQAIEEGRNSQYKGWRERGLLIETPGNVIDFDEIEYTAETESAKAGAKGVVYDPWQATQLANNLTGKGVPMIEMPMNARNLSEATKLLQALILEGRIVHSGNECLAWQISNVVGQFDRKDNVYPTKERPENKIDNAVALIMALAMHVRDLAEEPAYENHGLRVL